MELLYYFFEIVFNVMFDNEVYNNNIEFKEMIYFGKVLM